MGGGGERGEGRRVFQQNKLSSNTAHVRVFVPIYVTKNSVCSGITVVHYRK